MAQNTSDKGSELPPDLLDRLSRLPRATSTHETGSKFKNEAKRIIWRYIGVAHKLAEEAEDRPSLSVYDEAEAVHLQVWQKAHRAQKPEDIESYALAEAMAAAINSRPVPITDKLDRLTGDFAILIASSLAKTLAEKVAAAGDSMLQESTDPVMAAVVHCGNLLFELSPLPEFDDDKRIHLQKLHQILHHRIEGNMQHEDREISCEITALEQLKQGIVFESPFFMRHERLAAAKVLDGICDFMHQTTLVARNTQRGLRFHLVEITKALIEVIPKILAKPKDERREAIQQLLKAKGSAPKPYLEGPNHIAMPFSESKYTTKHEWALVFFRVIGLMALRGDDYPYKGGINLDTTGGQGGKQRPRSVPPTEPVTMQP